VEVDRPEIVAELTAIFAAYEQALVGNDSERLAGFFWDSERTVRFGIADHQLGADEVRQWRRAQRPLPPGRTLSGTRVSTFGTDFGVVTTFFTYPHGQAVADGGARGRKIGRQTQTWARLPEGWRIVSAHVSEVVATPAAG
jgi:hypothetical protein